MRRVGGRRPRVALAAVLMLTALPIGASAAPARPCAGVTTTPDGWRRVAPPVFSDKARVRSYAVAPRDTDVMFAASRYAIGRTTDGGCTWSTVYRVATATPVLPLTVSSAEILSLATGGSHVYALLHNPSGPAVAVSADRGATWRTVSMPVGAPFPWGGESARLVTDLSGRHAYLFADPKPFEAGVTAADLVYASDDGGATWSPRPVGTGSLDTVAASVRDIAVDPQTGTDLWATTSAGLLHSPDGGETWNVSETTERADMGLLSVTHRAGSPVQVLVASHREGLVYVRGTGGGLTAVNTPGPVTSLAGGRTAVDGAITTASGILELDFPNLRWSSANRGRLERVTTDYTATPRYYACVCDEEGDGSIWSRLPRRFEGPRRPEVDDPPPPDDPGFFPGDEGCAPGRGRPDGPAFAPSAVLPAAGEITLAPGQSKTVDYRFRVRPRDLDLFFLFDTGNRAERFGCAAQQGSVWAVGELSRTRNVRAGVGEYRDYPRTGTRLNLLPVLRPDCNRHVANGFVYRRGLRVAPLGAAFRQRVSGLTVGGCQTSHAALSGLLQAVTGEGRDLPPVGGSPYDVRPRQDAGFGDDAYKVIVHVNGASFATPGRDVGYPGPGFDPVIDALKAADVKQVGIYVAPPAKRHDEEVFEVEDSGDDDLVRVAKETRTLAQRPVDCGTTLTAEIGVGQPLVCAHLDDEKLTVPARTAPPLGRQMVELVGGLADPQPMRLAVLSGAGAAVSAVRPAAPRRLDHLLGHTLRYSVTYRCGADEAGTVKEVRLGGQVGADVVATATATVRCGTPPAVVIPRRPRELLPASVPIVAAPAAPAAPQVPANNLSVNTAPQPNAQPQNVAQGAAAGVAVPQEESQPRLAYADANPPDVADEYAMSARPRGMTRDLPAWMVVQVALVTTCAAGALAMQRARVARAKVRRQRF